MGDQPFGIRFFPELCALGADGQRVAQFERPERQVDQMASHVAEASIAEVPPLLPGSAAGHVSGVVGPVGSRTQPEIPV